MGVKWTGGDSRWHRAVQYRWDCDVCGESHQCAVIQRRGRSTLRLCLSCFRDGFWKGRP